jgi:hypothetical protein
MTLPNRLYPCRTSLNLFSAFKEWSDVELLVRNELFLMVISHKRFFEMQGTYHVNVVFEIDPEKTWRCQRRRDSRL